MGREHDPAGLEVHAGHHLGQIDFLAEIPGGTYETLHPDTVVLTVFGIECRWLTLERLIQVKRAAGRIKDLEAIAELEASAEEREP